MLFTALALVCFAYGMFWITGGIALGFLRPDFEATWKLALSCAVTWSVVFTYCVTCSYPLILIFVVGLNVALSVLTTWSRRPH